MTASVVIVSYRRTTSIPAIVKAWRDQEPAADVWLCDCSRDGLPINRAGITYVHAVPDPGSRVRHAVATMTRGDIVIKADDDILPLPGLVADFIKWGEKLGPCVMGIHGRTFHGPDYYRDTTMYAAHMQTAPLPVDFLGIITAAYRRFLPMDLRECGTDIEDLYWHNFCYPDAPKYVIPTANYNNKLPESRDAGRLCADMPGRAVRRAFYTKLWKDKYETVRPMTGMAAKLR